MPHQTVWPASFRELLSSRWQAGDAGAAPVSLWVLGFSYLCHRVYPLSDLLAYPWTLLETCASQKTSVNSILSDSFSHEARGPCLAGVPVRKRLSFPNGPLLPSSAKHDLGLHPLGPARPQVTAVHLTFLFKDVKTVAL